MNGPNVAQANTTGTAQIKPVKVVKVTKPSDGLAITVELGHDQQIKVDPIAIAGENFKLTGARRLRRHPAMYHRR